MENWLGLGGNYYFSSILIVFKGPAPMVAPLAYRQHVFDHSAKRLR
jgi:hypothetical protein